jgi:hypothetical protein
MKDEGMTGFEVTRVDPPEWIGEHVDHLLRGWDARDPDADGWNVPDPVDWSAMMVSPFDNGLEPNFDMTGYSTITRAGKIQYHDRIFTVLKISRQGEECLYAPESGMYFKVAAQ